MKQYSTRSKLIIVKEAFKNCNVKRTAANYEISERTLYYWISKIKSQGGKALENKSRKPHHSPNKITDEKIINKILELLETHKCGVDSVLLYLKKEKITISKSAVRRILKEHTLWKYRKKKKKKKYLGKHVQNFTEAGQKVQIDLKYVYFAHIRYYQFTAIDMASRVVYARLYKEKTPENALDFCQRLIKIFPFKIQTIQTDNGVEFTYRVQSYADKVPHPLDILCRENNIDRLYSKIASPWFNGCVERVHKTYQHSFYKYQNKILTLEQAQTEVANFTNYYNQERLHFSLNGDTPIQRLKKLKHSLQYVPA